MITSEPPRVAKHLFAGLFLLSMAMLLLELSLTRVLSVALWYHFGFLVISTALLGFGAAGVTLAIWPELRERFNLNKALSILALLFGLSTVVTFWLIQLVPFDPFSLLLDPRQLLYMPLYYLAIALPFYCGGLAVSLLLTRGASAVHRLYAVDLVGAAVGCALIAFAMPRLGGSGSVVLAAAFGFAAACAFVLTKARALAVVCGVLFLGSLGLTLAADKLLPILITPNKTGQSGPGPKRIPIYSAWNTISRIDVFQRQSRDGELERRIVIDGGTAATGMADLRPSVLEFLARHTDDTDYESGIAYIGKQHTKLLIIGSGAGSQVLDGLHYNASSITAVEINSIINDVVSNRMKDYWGGLFSQPQVHLVTDEARSFVRRSHDNYDAIISVHTISNAAVTSGAMSLAENYVLTREAFGDYLDHLAPDGVLYLTRPESQIPRLFTTAREVFTERHLGDVASHLLAYAMVYHSGPTAGRPAFASGFLLKKSAWTPEQLQQVCRMLSPPAGRGAPSLVLLYTPEQLSTEPYRTIVRTPNLAAFYASQPAQLSPATDDRPFFNQHARWSTLRPSTFVRVFRQGTRGREALEDLPIAETTLLILLAQSALVAAVLILLPLFLRSRAGLGIAGRGAVLLYFAGIGLGFILIEFALLQRFTLFLGEPVYTLAAVLSSLLLFTGVGSWFGGRSVMGGDSIRNSFLALLAALVLTAFLIPVLFAIGLGFALPIRITLSVLALAPLGITLGLPFPLGLRFAAHQGDELVPWAWGINAFFTVLGSVLALILGMSIGFRLVLLLAGLCYVAAWYAVAAMTRQDSKQLLSSS